MSATTTAAEALTLGARLSDRINPIVIKEVRQALRGKQFLVTFWLTVSAATLFGLSVILSLAADGDLDGLGQAFFATNYFCLVLAVQGFVPFAAFTAMGAEWEENTHDLLVISNLKPRQIVLGKLLSAGIQALLFFSATGPSLALTFLMGGVDLGAVLFALALTATVSFAATCLAICLSSLSHLRAVRVALMGLLVAGLFIALIPTTTYSMMLVGMPSRMSDPDFLEGTTAVLLGLLVLAALAIAVACARLAHPEENRSTGLRVLAVGSLVVGLVWTAFVHQRSFDPHMLSQVGCALIFAGLVWTVFFATEAETLGRRARLHVPRNRLLAALAVPFLPGGGRGMLLALLQIGLVLGGVVFIAVLFPHGSLSFDERGGFAMVLAAAYVTIYLGLPAGIFSRATHSARGRILVRCSVPILILAATFLPSVLGFLVGDRDLMVFRHPGHPFWLLDRLVYDGLGGFSGGLSILFAAILVLAGAAVLINARRMQAGVREVLAASAQRRELEGRAGSEAVDAGTQP